MNASRDPDSLIRGFLALGGDELSEAAFEDVRQAVGRTRQRATVGRWAVPSLRPLAVLMTALGVAVAALGTNLLAPTTEAGAEVSIGWSWVHPATQAFTAALPADAPPNLYWRAATFDRFDLTSWSQADATSRRVDAGQPLLAGPGELGPGERQLIVTITPRDLSSAPLVAPGVPLSVDYVTTVVTAGTSGWVAQVNRVGDGPYRVTASVFDPAVDPSITSGALEAASTAYPADVESRYTNVPAGALGPAATALLDEIVSLAGSRNPYRLAVTTEDYLRSARFIYQTDLSGVDCGGQGTVECFARTREGYCLHFATTMAILLRAVDPDNPIPTRLVEGFLPGTRAGGIETVLGSSASAWVEVYFPGYGWVRFNPTGGVPLEMPFPLPSPGTLASQAPAQP